jgi:hypothetical protein
MLSAYEIIVYTFLLLVLVYIALNYKKILPMDTALIAVALMVLLYTYMKNKSRIETFVDIPADKLNIEEDITSINPTCTFYTTSFNKESYDPSKNDPTWYSVIQPSPTKFLKFSIPPIFSSQEGFYLGNSDVVGPFCNELGIDFSQTYTIMLVCKHGSLVIDRVQDKPVNLFTLYANCQTNNGISLSIKQNTLANNNNVQVGQLELKFGDQEPWPCSVVSGELMNFDRDVLTFYFIMKDTDHVRVHMMSENSGTISPLYQENVNNDASITFANRELTINSEKNWNGYIYNFGIFNSALSDEEVTKIYNHIKDEYMKRKNSNYISVVNQYNDTIDMVKTISSCPFTSQSVCNSCQSVNKWYDTNQVIGASDTCKRSINDFCKSNPRNQWCKCWDSQNTSYTTPSCQMYRAIFGGKNTLLNSLTETEIEELKKNYDLVTSQQCSASNNKTVKREWATNKYVPDFPPQKARIALHKQEEEEDGEGVANSTQAKTKEIINYYGKADPTLKPVKDLEKEFSVTDMMKQSNTTFDPSQTVAFKEYQNIKNILEQQKTSKEVIAAPPQNETFFDKFLRVIVPS